MKSFSIISELDKAGGVKLPENFMGLCDVGEGDTLELCLDKGSVIMKKYPPTCIFCGASENLQEYREKSYCSYCADELKNYSQPYIRQL